MIQSAHTFRNSELLRLGVVSTYWYVKSVDVRARRRNLFATWDAFPTDHRTHMSLALRDPGPGGDEDVLARHHRRRDRLTTLAIGVLTVDHDQWAPRRAEQRSGLAPSIVH